MNSQLASAWRKCPVFRNQVASTSPPLPFSGLSAPGCGASPPRLNIAWRISSSCRAVVFGCTLVTIFGGVRRVEAESIRYTVDWTAGAFSQGDPLGLAGASFHLEMEWDPATTHSNIDSDLTTYWRPEDSQMVTQLTLHGSNVDGTYTSFFLPSNTWHLSDNSSFDMVEFPTLLTVTLGGQAFPMEIPHRRRRNSLLQLVRPPADGIYYPFAFATSDVVSWSGPDVRYFLFDQVHGVYYDSISIGSNVSGHAEFVPEPAGVILGSLGLAGLVIVASTKSWCRFGAEPVGELGAHSDESDGFVQEYFAAYDVICPALRHIQRPCRRQANETTCDCRSCFDRDSAAIYADACGQLAGQLRAARAYYCRGVFGAWLATRERWLLATGLAVSAVEVSCAVSSFFR